MLSSPAFTQAAVDWPQLPAPDGEFASFVRDRGIDEAHPTRASDLLLAFHAGRGHPIAIAAISGLLEQLRPPMRRTGADSSAIDELLAELPADLCTPRDGGAPRIYGYSGRGPLVAWLRVVAIRTMIKRRQRAEDPAGNDHELAELAAPDLGPELAIVRARYAREFRAAFGAAIERLEPHDRALLRQHHLDGVGLDQLARLHAVHRATIARRLAAARDAISATVRRRLLSELRVGGDTVDSIIRLVHGEIEQSLERYL
jgi:RNA polymerase sigma-70 factor, ECF subfamily